MPVDGGALELAASQGKGGHSPNSRSGELETAQQALKCGEPLYIASGREAPHPTGACIALPLQLVPEVLGVLTFDIAGSWPPKDEDMHFLQARTTELEARIQQLEQQWTDFDAFVTYQEAVGSERDVLVLTAQAVQAVCVSLPHVSVAYDELEALFWKARVWSEDVSDEVIAQMRAGVSLEAPSLAEALRIRAAVFAVGRNASNSLPNASVYGAAAFVRLLVRGEPRGQYEGNGIGLSLRSWSSTTARFG